MFICKLCGKEYQEHIGTQRYCSADCKQEVKRMRARRGMRQARNRLRYKDVHKCQVCSYDKVVDIHHEGNLLYVLCPNHHACITRGVCNISDYGIEPIEQVQH